VASPKPTILTIHRKAHPLTARKQLPQAIFPKSYQPCKHLLIWFGFKPAYSLKSFI